MESIRACRSQHTHSTSYSRDENVSGQNETGDIKTTHTADDGPPRSSGVLNVVAMDEHIPMILKAKEIVPRLVNSRLKDGCRQRRHSEINAPNHCVIHVPCSLDPGAQRHRR